MRYVNVILPLPLRGSYTYSLPDDIVENIVPGSRVIVSFGKRKYYTAIVTRSFESNELTDLPYKEVYMLLDPTPVVTETQLKFWAWLSDYYMCSLGEIYNAAMPSRLKIQSETMVLKREGTETDDRLLPSEQLVMDALREKPAQSISDLQKTTRLSNVFKTVLLLIDKEEVTVNEAIKDAYAPKSETCLRLSDAFRSEEALNRLFDSLTRAPKQKDALLKFLDLSNAPAYDTEVSKKMLTDTPQCVPSALSALIRKGVIECYQKELSRLNSTSFPQSEAHELTPAQQQACQSIRDIFQSKNICLLHGVASSGKTEIYIHFIKETLDAGRQVLYLLPEIVVSAQITERLRRVFGDRMLVYHSRISDNERVEIWQQLLHPERACLILGVRSSIFLPLQHIGLVVIDEEQDSSYKQQDPAPRYQARDAAIFLAAMMQAKVLLGTATPSIESLFNVQNGKYGYVKLKERYGDAAAPEIVVVDVKDLQRKKIMKDTLFSPLLVERIREVLDQKEQVILFQNRRGFAPMLKCHDCGWVPRCPHCDVSLTYHKYYNQMVCHYCGYMAPLPTVCPKCGGTQLQTVGFGTEKVEEEIATLFPQARTERLDVDSARSRTSYEKILSNFESGRTSILIGTQMLTKGLDFDHIRLVGILNADNMMNYPDFRAYERAFQLMVQVSGRAGRRDRRGLVILQTSQPDHPLIEMVRDVNYKAMYQSQLEERLQFHYPPYYRLVIIVMKSHDANDLPETALKYTNHLRQQLGDRVIGPITPLISKIRNSYIRKVMLKLELSISYHPVRRTLEEASDYIYHTNPRGGFNIYYDVDPY